MTPELYEAVAKIARHCWRGVHWEKGPDGPRPVREPLKKHHLEGHVNGGAGVGLAPITPGESTTRIAVLDFDSHKGDVTWDEMAAHAKRVAGSLTAKGLSVIPFRSSGGKGIHLICLWDTPQDAYSVRTLFTSALTECGLKVGTKGVKHGEVEIFPKQDSVPIDGLGNMFVLPMCGESLPLDPHTFEIRPHSYAEDITDWPKSKAVPVVTKPVDTGQKHSTIDPASLTTTLAELRSALAAIPNEGSESLDYDSWRNMIFAIHHATDGSAEGLALAHEFSQRSSKYDPQFLDERVWPYIRSERGGNTITAATIFNRARTHGWNDDVLADFEDLGVLEGEALRESSDASTAAPPGAATATGAAPARFSVVPIHVFAERPSPPWIVRGVLPKAELATIIGPSGSGKSFFAFDLACAIAQGSDWRGFKTTAGKVVYIVAEGAGHFHHRAVAYAKHYNRSLNALQIGVISDTPNLMQKEDVKSLVQQVQAFGPVDVIVVDTFAQVTPGANENAAEDMGRALANCKALHRATGALIVLVHHVGKDEARGSRGWSGIKAAADVEITITRTDTSRKATVSKLKDGPDGAELPFKLLDVTIGMDEEGEAITSCVVEHVAASEEKGRAVKLPPAGLQREVWFCVDALLTQYAEIETGGVLTEFVKTRAIDTEKKGSRNRCRDTARVALQSLAQAGWISVENDMVRRP